MQEIKMNTAKNERTWIAEIDCSMIQSWSDYTEQIENAFKFPTLCRDSIDRYLDWIRDLSWLDVDGVVLIFNNFSKFMTNNAKMKKELIEDFENIILPWWQGDVKQFMVGGETKDFRVLLVD